MLVGTWAAATWAIRFYERHGFALVSPQRKTALLKSYRTIPERQKPRSCSPIRQSVASDGLATAAPALEFVVHAGGEILNVVVAETHEIIFGEHRPVWREHPFGAAADRPARCCWSNSGRLACRRG
jgi:hypothetical protein